MSSQVQILQTVVKVINALKEIAESYIDLCIDDEMEMEVMDEFCEKSGIEDDETCEDIWDMITNNFDDIVKIRIEFNEEKLKEKLNEVLKQREQGEQKQPIKVEGVKTMDEFTKTLNQNVEQNRQKQISQSNDVFEKFVKYVERFVERHRKAYEYGVDPLELLPASTADKFCKELGIDPDSTDCTLLWQDVLNDPDVAIYGKVDRDRIREIVEKYRSKSSEA